MQTETATPSALRKVILASSAGTLIEWYDFYIFGSLTTIISTRFFPKENPTADYLATLALFATGFIIRPFGAVIFGRLGDMLGRKFTFLLTLVLMGFSTFAIGLVPSYESIGMLAPVLVLLLRLLQGLALGGEYGGAATYVAEYSPDGKRGYYTSFIQTTATIGLFVSLGVILAVRLSLSPEQFSAWGWRVPFLLSIVLVLLSYIIRRRLHESPAYTALRAGGKVSKHPLRESFGNRENLKWVLIALFGATAGQGVIWYTGQFYALSFIQKTLSVEFTQSNIIVAAALLLATPFFIYFGGLSDRIGRKKIMLTGMLLAALAYYPIYKTMYAVGDLKQKQEIHTEKSISGTGFTEITKEQKTYADGTVAVTTVTIDKSNSKTETKKEITLSFLSCFWLSLLVFVQVFFVTMVYGPIAAFLVELFPVHIRYTSMSLPYHIGNGVFGGLTPFIATAVVAATGNPFAGLIYPIAIALLTFLIGLIFLKQRQES